MYKRTFMQTLAAVAMMMLPAACADDYDDSALWDKVNDHEERLAALEKWQEQTNQSIAAMQELLNTTDMITGVTAVTEDGETVGYTITFLHSDPITIYNGAKGADGEDGADGADGQTPQIGLAQAEDGNWYWTLNGELLTDAQGNPIRANGLDGADGADGEDGATGPEGPQGNDGTSAPTPQILLGSNIPASGNVQTDNGKAIDNAWYLSVDNGATWYRVSGADGTNGDTWFAKAPEKVGNYYLFTLADQSTFRVAAYQPFCILAKGETLESFDNATVPVNEATTLYLSIDEGIEYSSIVAQATPVDADAVLTRADVSDWTVVKGTEQNTLTVTPGTQPYALLDVSLLLTDGSKLTASRLLEGPGYTDDGQGNYTVTSAEDLKNIAKLVNEQWNLGINITLTSDIDLSGIDWTPIGIDYNHRYTGTFDGGGHTITGLTVTGSYKYAGLFGDIDENGTVKNVVLEDVQITSDNSSGYAGGVAGDSWGTIENCSVSGSVSGTTFAGGVVGSQWGGSITGCNSSATVKGVIFAGGIAGETNSGASLTGCYATGDVTVENDGTNNSHAGGVVGYNGGGTLTACYATGSVTGSGSGTIYVGGVTGSNNLGILTACYHAKGTVSGPDGATGGVAGRNFKDSMFGGGIITACYWGGNGQTQGIGEDQVGTGGTTQVTDDLWQNALAHMNAALNKSGWTYRLGGGNLPELVQNQ